ncbi:MAG TPA: NUDIX domain-containing protein [Ignavibacteria bacterium]|nr:NUDIX domain-containing protein [Ignavibacteria bacterium]HRB01548.1 NUDIX domain-containing protein [Ignavibacteria bacterium]
MELKKDRSIGVIIFHLNNGEPEFLIIKHRQGHWSFAKGHKEKEESDYQTAIRELKEETGIKDANFISDKIELSEMYKFNSANNFKIEKSVDYFIAEVPTNEVNIDNMEILEYQWRNLCSGLELVTFAESKNILNKAYEIIINKNKNVI